MALPRANYTNIPNDILDNMHSLNNPELRVLLAICRKTIGWRRETDRISHSQLVAMTGLSVNSIKKARESLSQKGLISWEQKGSGRGIQTYYDINVSESNISSSDTINDPIISRDDTIAPIIISPGDTTKEKDIKKGELNKTSKVDQEALNTAKHLFDSIQSKVQPATWKTNKPDYAKWHKPIEALHRIDGVEYRDIHDVIDWVTSDPFWRQNVLSGESLRKYFNKLHIRMKSSRPNSRPVIDYDARLAELNAKRGCI